MLASWLTAERASVVLCCVRARRLQVMIASLRARDDQNSALNDARVEKVRQEKAAARDETFEKIFKQRVKVHRALAKHRVGQEKKEHKRDIIAEHASHASKVPVLHRAVRAFGECCPIRRGPSACIVNLV